MTMNNSADNSKQNQNANRVAWEGSSVLLDINDGERMVFARLSPNSTLKIGNKTCSLRPLIGCPYGSLFQVENGTEGPFLSRALPATDGNNLQEASECEVMDVSKDNRGLVDNNTAQSLTGQDIDDMRRQGMSGAGIVEALIANSATFEKKTLFSQEKYRLKKQKKYAPKVLLRRPFTRSICEAYFNKHPSRIGFLRVDTLSLLLSMANVTANSDVLVMDMVGGILTGAVAERLGGTGYVCNTYQGLTPYSIDIVRIFNFSNEINERIVQYSLSELNLSQNEAAESNEKSEDEELFSSSVAQKVSTEGNGLLSEDGSKHIMLGTIASPISKTSKGIKAGQKPPLDAVSSWKENGFSSLLVAAPDLDAWSIVKELLPLLSFSAPFAIYHQYREVLATCMHNVQHEKLAIGLQITEPWLREYQVLPSRTHPRMQMDASGGYILSGIRICSSDHT